MWSLPCTRHPSSIYDLQSFATVRPKNQLPNKRAFKLREEENGFTITGIPAERHASVSHPSDPVIKTGFQRPSRVRISRKRDF